MNLTNKISKAKEYYALLNDETYLLGCDIEKQTMLKVVMLFTESKCSKTEFCLLTQLMKSSLNKEECCFVFKLNDLTKDIAKPNLSRALKGLESCGFITKLKVENSESFYFFDAQFEVLLEYI